MTLGRVLTFFFMDVRFALTPKIAFFVSIGDRQAALTVLRETTVVECADVGNAITFNASGTRWPYRILRPIELTDDAEFLGGFAHIFNLTTRIAPRATLDADEARKKETLDSIIARHHLSVFQRKDDVHPFSVRTRYASLVSVAYELESEDWKDKPQGHVDGFFMNVYDEFIDVYRAKTTDVRPTYYRNSDQLVFAAQMFAPYSADELTMGWRERLMSSAKPELFDSRSATSITFPAEPQDQFIGISRETFPELTRSVADFLSHGRPMPESRKILSLAQRAVERNKNSNTAVIESAIAMEVALGTILKQYKILKGVSARKLEDTKRDLGLSYQLNVELVMMLDPVTVEERAIIGAADVVRSLRNGIIHEGASVSEDQGNKAIRDIRALLNMLSARGHFV